MPYCRVAGNPKDPAKIEESKSAASSTMRDQDRAIADSVAKVVMAITHGTGVNEWDETRAVSD
jgi:hypothetical protein